MNNIFDVKLAKNEFNLLKTILFLVMIVYTFLIILAYTSNNAYNMRYSAQQFTTSYMTLVQLAYYTSIFIVSVYSFKYIYNRKALDMYHTLPIKKTTLLLTKLITGYISVSIIFAVAFYIVSSFNTNLATKDILQLLALSLLSGLFEYGCFMLVATICNGIFFHILLTASILLIPTLISTLINTFNHLYTFIYIYSDLNMSDYGFGVTITKLFSTFFVTNSGFRNVTFRVNMYADNPQLIIFMIALTVSIILLSVYSYNLRKSEDLSSYIIFKPVRIFFQSCVTFIITILIARIFISEVSIIFIYTSCIILSIALTFIIDCILNFKIINIRYNIPYYITPLISILVFINAYDNNLYGLFNAPKPSNVQVATISSADDWYGDTVAIRAVQTTDFGKPYYSSGNLIKLTTQESINQLIQLQDTQFNKFTKDEYGIKGNTGLTVSYTLDNGKTILRTFRIEVLDYVDAINYIQSNSLNKQDVIDILSNSSQYYTSLDLSTFVPISIDDKMQEDVIKAILQDVTNDDSFRTIGYQSPIIGSAMIFTKYDDEQVTRTPIMIKLDYTNTLQILGIDVNSFDILAVPEQDIQYNGDPSQIVSVPNHCLNLTTDILRKQIENFPDMYYNSEHSQLSIDYLIDELQLNDYTYLTGNDTSIYWNSEVYTDDWLEYPVGLRLFNNLVKIDDSQYYRTFIVIDDKVLMDSEQLVRLPN